MNEEEKYELTDVFLLQEELWCNDDERERASIAVKLKNSLRLVEEFFPEDIPF